MKLYGEIKKTIANDDGTLIVSGIASSESVDSDGEVILSKAIADAIPDYMRFGAVREMHNNSACGTALSMMVVNDKTMFEALVVDPIAVKKINTGVYKGFSIGGKITKRNDVNKNIIEGLKLVEVSLVDRPANPESIFTMVKFDDAEEAPPQTSVTENSATIIQEEKPMSQQEIKKENVEQEVVKQEIVKQEEMPMQEKKDPVMMLKEAYAHIQKGMMLMKECGMGEEEKAEESAPQPKEEETMAYSAKTELHKAEVVSKLENENKELKAELEKRNKEMEHLLEETNKAIKSFEAKGFLKAVAVAKSEDSGNVQKEEQPKNTIEALKKVYSQGGKPFGYNF